MYRHWAFQPLALVALLFALGFSQLNEILATDFCRNASSPPALVKMATWAGVCLPETKTRIPSVLTSWELHTLQPVANKLPDPTEMVNNRVEIGKISAALAAIGTPESQLMMDAIEKYDDQAKATIRSLSKLSYASTLTHNTLVGSLAGIVKALVEFPKGEKRPRVLRTMIQLRQDAIDAWVQGLQDELKELLSQASETLANLDGCDLHLKQVLRTSGRAKGQQQENAGPEAAHDWGQTLFGAGHEHIRPAALEAVTKLEALIRESSLARDVVGRLSIDVVKLMTGIEAAYRYPDTMLAVEMTLEKEVELVVDMLRKLGGDAELVGAPRNIEDGTDPE
ncbi:hypothetical protein NLJ89_g7478 [Agrocybe chaxingu]|uniref:Uncharacterized protein n=1 Tax=Agrocybe chaxingu TaxID=84603 RepID=A0A9W8MTN1_9AGAR|nr:hypothetical protein NLJ89_g7478 [Agrocybe chaxingu]